MITKENRPLGYQPYQTVSICGSRLIGGGDIFAIGSVVPLLVGRGPTPLIWLQALASPQSQEFVTLVDASVSRHPLVSVVSDGTEVSVSAGGILLLRVASFSTDSVTIDRLDLRPVGLNAYGDAVTLNVGGMQMMNSSFSGAPGFAMFGFGPEPR